MATFGSSFFFYFHVVFVIVGTRAGIIIIYSKLLRLLLLMLAAAAGRKHHLLFFPCSLTKYVRRASAYVSEDMNLKSDALCSHSNESVKNRSFFIFIFASDGYPLSTHAGRTTYGRAPQLLLFVNSIRPVISFHWSTREITHTSYDLSVWHGHHSQWLPFYQLTEQRRPSTCAQHTERAET